MTSIPKTGIDPLTHYPTPQSQNLNPAQNKIGKTACRVLDACADPVGFTAICITITIATGGLAVLGTAAAVGAAAIKVKYFDDYSLSNYLFPKNITPNPTSDNQVDMVKNCNQDLNVTARQLETVSGQVETQTQVLKMNTENLNKNIEKTQECGEQLSLNASKLIAQLDNSEILIKQLTHQIKLLTEENEKKDKLIDQLENELEKLKKQKA